MTALFKAPVNEDGEVTAGAAIFWAEITCPPGLVMIMCFCGALEMTVPPSRGRDDAMVTVEGEDALLRARPTLEAS